MRHSDIQTTLGIYAHSTEKKKAESMAELEGKNKYRIISNRAYLVYTLDRLYFYIFNNELA